MPLCEEVAVTTVEYEGIGYSVCGTHAKQFNNQYILQLEIPNDLKEGKSLYITSPDKSDLEIISRCIKRQRLTRLSEIIQIAMSLDNDDIRLEVK